MNLKTQSRRTALIIGIITGLITSLIFKMYFIDPFIIISEFNTTNILFFISNSAWNFTAWIISIIISGFVTTIVLTSKKRNEIYGGLTGIIVAIIMMIFIFTAGMVKIPTSSEVVITLGPLGYIILFLIYLIPLGAFGFIFGYIGGIISKLLIKIKNK
jgi:hypothetical protein